MKNTLFLEAYRFSFFQAVRLLEWIYPNREPVGKTARPREEVVHFTARQTLCFPASEIHRLRASAPEDGSPARMSVNFMGLTGALGVLPRHYTELLLERARQRDFSPRDFFDLFNHRIISLFYRAWEKYHFPVGYEHGRDGFSSYLSSIAGFGTPALDKRVSVDDEVFRFYAGLFNQKPRSASALEGILSDYFQSPIRVRQFVGRWARLGSENESRLGVQNCRLGSDAILGERIWERQSRFRIRVGPLDLEFFRRLLPVGGAYPQLVDLARVFAGGQFDFEAQLVLKSRAVPACVLSATAQEGPRLGWSSWLKTREFSRDPEETVFGCSLEGR